MDRLKVGEVCEIDGIQFVLTERLRQPVQMEGAEAEAVLRAHPDWRFAQVVRELRVRGPKTYREREMTSSRPRLKFNKAIGP